jgi:hypothetical protein
MGVLEVYALHLSRDLAYIVGVAPINSIFCNIFHQILPFAGYITIVLHDYPWLKKAALGLIGLLAMLQKG